MADSREVAEVARAAKFRDAALVLADDANQMAKNLGKYVRSGQYERAEALAADLQRTARDVKWLTERAKNRKR